MFRISDQYEIVVNPKISNASVTNSRRRNGPQKDRVAEGLNTIGHIRMRSLGISRKGLIDSHHDWVRLLLRTPKFLAKAAAQNVIWRIELMDQRHRRQNREGRDEGVGKCEFQIR